MYRDSNISSRMNLFFIVFVFMFLFSLGDGYACVNLTLESDPYIVNSDVTLCTGIYLKWGSGIDYAVYINGSNVTLDCNGSVIKYDAVAIGVDGITISPGMNNITIKNCTFYDFYEGFSTNTNKNITIQDSNFSNNNKNIKFNLVSDSLIVNTTIFGASDVGIWLDHSENITIYNNTITQNTASGIKFDNTTDSLIDNNTIVDNGDVTNPNIYLKDSSNSIIKYNNIIDSLSTGYAIIVEKTTGVAKENKIMNNFINTHLFVGVRLISSNRTLIYNNTFSDVGNGVTTSSIKLEGSTTNTNITSNTIEYSKKIGIYVELTSATAKNIIFSNDILNSIEYGIYIKGTSTDNINITNNNIFGAPIAGIYLDGGNDNVRIIDNNISNDISVLGSGIYMSGNSQDINISNNNISFAINEGIYLNPTGANVFYNFIRSNGDDLVINSPTDTNIINNALTKDFDCTGATCSGNIIANLIVDNDTNPIRDYTNITDAVGAASANDKIFVYDGYYNESVNVTKENMTLVGQTKENAVVNCSNNDYTFKLNANNITIENFTVECGGMGNGMGIILDNTNYTSILNTIIENSKNGIVFERSSYYNLIYRVFFDVISGTGISMDGSMFYNYNNITENNFSLNTQDIDFTVNSVNNSIWKNNFTSNNNDYQNDINDYCINGWDNWYNESAPIQPECGASFVVVWNDSVIYVNDSVRLIVNLTGETEIAQLNATIWWNDTYTNYSLSYLPDSGGNISGAWYLDFTNTSYEGEYYPDTIYRLDADGDYNVSVLSAVPLLTTKILEMNSTFEDKIREIYNIVNISVNVTNNASVIENVTAYILKPDGSTDVNVFIFKGNISEIYTYELYYKNSDLSGNYEINITTYAQNTVTKNQSYTINYGSPQITRVHVNEHMLNNTNSTQSYFVKAINGDLKDVNLTLNFNDSFVEFNNNSASKNISMISSGNEIYIEWNITSVGVGVVSANLTIFNDTILEPNGYVGTDNQTITVLNEGADTEAPNITNVQIENDYTIYNLNETVTVYVNVTDNIGVETATLNITHPSGFTKNISYNKRQTYLDGVVLFTFLVDNVTELTSIDSYEFDITAMDSANSITSDKTNFNTTDVYNVSINIYEIYNRGEWVNVTLDVLNVHNLSVEGFSTTINLTDTQGNISTLQNGNYFVTATNKTGIYSIYANASYLGNSGNATKPFNITDELIATVLEPPVGYRPGIGESLNVRFIVSTARGTIYPYVANYTAYCYVSSGVWGYNVNTEGTAGSEEIIVFSQYNNTCLADNSYDTEFNITFNITDNLYNNSGIDAHNWTTKSAGGTTPPGGGGAGGSGGGSGGGFGSPGENITIVVEGNITDYTFLLKPETITIEKGDTESITGVLDNIGDFDVNLSVDIDEDCCSVGANKYFYISTKNKINFPIRVSTNLTVIPGEYSVVVTTKTLDLNNNETHVDIEKTETLIVVIEENGYIKNLNDIKTRLEELKRIIEQHKTSGVSVYALQKQYDIIGASIQKAQKAINDNDLDTLRTEVNSLKIEKVKLETQIKGLELILWLNKNKENIIIGLVSFVVLFFLTTKFLLPYAWMKNDLRHLRKREKELTEIRKSTEIQYFKRQIDEATFTKMMADKHSALTEVRTKIGDIDVALSLLKRGKIGSHDGSKKYSFSSKFKVIFASVGVFLRKKLHLNAKKIEEVKKPRQDMFVVNNRFDAGNNSTIIHDKTYTGPFASIRQKYHEWSKNKKESKIDKEIQELEQKEKKLEKKEDVIKSEISDLEKEKQEVENS